MTLLALIKAKVINMLIALGTMQGSVCVLEPMFCRVFFEGTVELLAANGPTASQALRKMFPADHLHVSAHVLAGHMCQHMLYYSIPHKSQAYHCSCSLLLRTIMEVTLKQTWVLTANGVNWSIPAALLGFHLGYMWLKIRASCYGLGRLLGWDPTHGKSFHSFKGSAGLDALLRMRNKASGLLDDNDKHLFHFEAPKKKRKVAGSKIDPADPSAVNVVHLDLGTHGVLKAMKASKKREDLVICLEQEYIKMFLDFMYSQGISFSTPSRQYRKTGRFTKEALAARSSKDDLEEASAAEEEEDDDDDGDEQAAAEDES